MGYRINSRLNAYECTICGAVFDKWSEYLTHKEYSNCKYYFDTAICPVCKGKKGRRLLETNEWLYCRECLGSGRVHK